MAKDSQNAEHSLRRKFSRLGSGCPHVPKYEPVVKKPAWLNRVCIKKGQQELVKHLEHNSYKEWLRKLG